MEFTLRTVLCIEVLSSQLLDQLSTDTCNAQRLVECISKNVPHDQIQQPKFIRALVTAICQNAIIPGKQMVLINTH